MVTEQLLTTVRSKYKHTTFTTTRILGHKLQKSMGYSNTVNIPEEK